MDRRIIDLKTTTFSGRQLTRKQLQAVQETVDHLPNESRNELAKVICEHLHWKTKKGDYKVAACLGMLEKLARQGIITLPARREAMVRNNTQQKPVWTSESDPQPLIAVSLAALSPLRLERVTDTEGRQLWNAFVDRYHYLGYRKPFGEHIRYFVGDHFGRRLGCLMYETATLDLTCRDRWVGWTQRQKARTRQQLIQNSRFLIFPWVNVKNLASASLALSLRQVAADWEQFYQFRPVLCETFVEKERFAAPCYRAANWQLVGETRGQNKSVKSVYIWPFETACRAILRGEKAVKAPPKPKTAAQKGRRGANDRAFQKRQQALIAAATAVAAKEDQNWQQRRRVFRTLWIILFVIRLVAMPGRVSYKIALSAMWEHCRDYHIPLPQPIFNKISQKMTKFEDFRDRMEFLC